MKLGMGEEEDTLEDWLDRHHVHTISTEVVTLDGTVIGKQIHRDKFVGALPFGLQLPDLVLGWDITGNAYFGWWHDFRKDNFGDIQVRPDLSTLISEARDPNLGRCFADLVDHEGQEILLAPRNLLRHSLRQLEKSGFEARVAMELEFMLFRETFEQARAQDFRELTPVTASLHNIGYLSRNSYLIREFMNELIERIEWQSLQWESWHDEAAPGQIELNLVATDPLRMADQVVRIRELIFEVAVSMGMSATFMAKPHAGYPNGMHIHQSLYKDGKNAFAAPGEQLSTTANHWLGGVMTTLPAQVSLMCPTVNSYRRPVDFNVTPISNTWDEDNRTSALRLVSRSPESTRFECRVGAADMNPYLALAGLIAGGLAGLRHQLTAPAPYRNANWSPTEEVPTLPNSLSSANQALLADEYLVETLGSEFIRYWSKTREWEWEKFHEAGNDPDSKEVTNWELNRYFGML